MASLHENYRILQEKIVQIARGCGRDPKEICLIAVSKRQPLEGILDLYDAGCRHFGESRIQEALSKIEKAPSEITWHFIGTLQKNKVRKAVGVFSWIHSVDTPDLAEKIDQIGQDLGVTTNLLLQVNTSGERSKQGLSSEEWKGEMAPLLKREKIRIRGLMTMAPFIEDEEEIRQSFRRLREFRDELNGGICSARPLQELSMGMSHDYPIAIEEGATFLRIGGEIFGQRSF